MAWRVIAGMLDRVCCMGLMLALAGCVTRTPPAVGRLEACRSTSEAVGSICWPERIVDRDPWATMPLAEGWKIDRLGRRGTAYLYGMTIEPVYHKVGAHVMLIARTNCSIDGRTRVPHGTIRTMWQDTASGKQYPLAFEMNGDAVLVEAFPPNAWDAPYSGLVVFLGSMQTLSSPERRLIEGLNASGWLVAYCFSPGSLWMGAESHVMMPTRDGLADLLAGRIDNYLSESAYAAAALVDYFHEAQPELAERPVVLVGASAGALAAPAAAARLGDRISACVLIGGGAGVYNIIIDGTRTTALIPPNMFVRAEPDDERTAKYIQIDPRDAAFREAVIERTALDPAYTAAALLDKPVLMLLARDDDIVPISRGEALYEKLNRPERWLYPCGHELMFFFLPNRVEPLLAWVESAVADRRVRKAEDTACRGRQTVAR